MQYILDHSDFAKLSVSAQSELSNLLFRPRSERDPSTNSADYAGFDMSDVADLDEQQIRFWMEAAQDPTKNGLRVAAEYGPVFDAWRLSDAGVNNVAHFQSRTTIRTRTVTGNKHAYLLSWDDNWEWEGKRPVSGRYAVSECTFRSLRKYFGL